MSGNVIEESDANGNTTSETNSSGHATTYTWDYENRLTRIAYLTGRVVNYEYDPFGRRILGGNPQKIFAYDGDNLIEDLNTSGSVAVEYTEGLGIDEPMEETASGTSDYYEADGLGSITSLTKSDGSVAGTYTYDSFGNVTAMTGGLSNRLEYTAREFDPDSGIFFLPLPGLLYDRARYYDPLLGRFLSEDPIGLAGGINVYSYTANDPTDLTDPDGRQAGAAVAAGSAIDAVVAACAANPLVCAAIITSPLWAPPLAHAVSEAASDAWRDAQSFAGRKAERSNRKCAHCAPCVPPVGTIGYRADTSAESRPHRGVPPPHWRLYVVTQNPLNCQCWWQDVPENSGGFGAGLPPAGAVPITGPAGGGGFAP